MIGDLRGVLVILGAVSLPLTVGWIRRIRLLEADRRRLRHQVTRLAGRVYDLTRENDWLAEQAEVKAAQATTRSRQLAHAIGHPAVSNGPKLRVVGRD